MEDSVSAALIQVLEESWQTEMLSLHVSKSRRSGNALGCLPA